MFSGPSYMTKGVSELLNPVEILAIRQDLMMFVQQKGGIDYLQVYDNTETGQVIYCIDQLSESMKASGGYSKQQVEEYGYNTMLLREEY